MPPQPDTPPWRYIEHGPASPARNMAIDEALLRELPKSGAPILRVYQWDRPAVSIGYFQDKVLAPIDRPWIRRYTGGGLVDHAADVTYTILAPRGHPWLDLPVPESYAVIHRGVQAVFREMGISSTLAPAASESDSPACFEKPVKFDLVPDGSPLAKMVKLGGAAQRRTREGMLHQGSVLPPDSALRPLLLAKFAEVFSRSLDLGAFSKSELSENELARADLLEVERYGTEAWNLGI